MFSPAPARRARDVGAIDATRPILDNGDGSFSTEETITIEADGKWINLPTIVDGERRTEEEAVALWREGKNRSVGEFASLQEAERVAAERSQEVGRRRLLSDLPPGVRFARAPTAPAGPDIERPSRGQLFRAGREQTRVADLYTSGQRNLGAALDGVFDDIAAQGGPDRPWTLTGAARATQEPRVTLDLYRQWREALPEDERRRTPSVEQVRHHADNLARYRYETAAGITAQARGPLDHASVFAGAMTEAVLDPPNFVTLFMGAGAARTVLGAAGREAALGAAIEGPQQPQIQAYRAELGLPSGFGQGLANTAFAAGGAGVFGGGAAALGKYLTRGQARALVDHVEAIEAEAPRPDIPEGRAAHRAALAEAEAALLEGRPPRIADAPELVEAGPVQALRGAVATGEAAADLRLYDPDELNVDAARFQFKEGGDEAGVTDRLRGVETWRPERAGVSLIWEDEAGRLWVADGHQRRGLASRIKAADPAQNPMLTGFVLRAADGYSAADARLAAAQKNIAEGTGSPLDVAKILREAGPGAALDLPPSSALVRQGRGLAALSDDAFGMVVNDLVDPAHAAAVGRLMADLPAQHAEALRILRQAEPASLAEAENIVRDVREAGAIVETQTTLFGEEAASRPLYAERAKVLSAAETAIRRDRAAFAMLAREERRLAEEGNTLNTAANVERAQTDAETLEILQRLARRKGPVADALAEAARDLAGGGRLADVVEGFVRAVRGADGGNGGAGARAGAAGDAAGRADGSPDEAPGGGEPAGIAARGGLEAEARADQAALFDAPDADSAARAADPVMHDLRDGIARGGDPLVELEDGRTLRTSELLDELDAEDAAIARLKGCLP